MSATAPGLDHAEPERAGVGVDAALGDRRVGLAGRAPRRRPGAGRRRAAPRSTTSLRQLLEHVLARRPPRRGSRASRPRRGRSSTCALAMLIDPVRSPGQPLGRPVGRARRCARRPRRSRAPPPEPERLGQPELGRDVAVAACTCSAGSPVSVDARGLRGGADVHPHDGRAQVAGRRRRAPRPSTRGVDRDPRRSAPVARRPPRCAARTAARAPTTTRPGPARPSPAAGGGRVRRRGRRDRRALEIEDPRARALRPEVDPEDIR